MACVFFFFFSSSILYSRVDLLCQQKRPKAMYSFLVSCCKYCHFSGLYLILLLEATGFVVSESVMDSLLCVLSFASLSPGHLQDVVTTARVFPVSG